MTELYAGVDDARGGRGRFFVVTGEPGIGKTRLADQVAIHAAECAMVVLRAGCWEGGGAPAYWPFIQLVRAALADALQNNRIPSSKAASAGKLIQDLIDLVAELQYPAVRPADLSIQPGASPEQARFKLVDSVATAIRQMSGLLPLMLILEDLHEADQPSLLMLRFLVRQLKDAPVLVLCTYRHVEVQRSPALSQLIGSLMREGAHVPLFGMSLEDAGRMIEERAGTISRRLVTDIYLATAGNPLFIDGVVRVLAAEGKLLSAKRLDLAAFRVPDGLREAIRCELGLISDHSALIPAAIIGQQFELSCLQRITRVPVLQLVDLLSEAATVGIVVQLTNRSYAFTHALIRNALSDELNATQRAQLHARIGEALEQIYQADVEAHLAQLAYHFRQAGDTSRAIDYSVRAGHSAWAVFAYEEAIAHWQEALRLMPEDGEDRQRRAGLLERTAELLGLTGSDRDEQFKCLRQALKLYRDLGYTQAVARLEARITGWLMLRVDAGSVSRTVEDNSKTASSDRQSAGEEAFAVRLHIKAAVAMEALQVEQALAASQQAMEMSEQRGDSALWAHASVVHANALYASGRLAQALSLMRRALAAAEPLRDALPGSGLATLLTAALFWLRDPAPAVAPLEHELAQPRMTEAALLRGIMFDWLGLVEALRGNLSVAKGLSGQARGASLFEGAIAFYQGEWERADQALVQALDQARGRRQQACGCRAWLAIVRRALGQCSAAKALLQENLAIAIEGPYVAFEVDARQGLALIYAETGRPEKAHPHLTRCRAIIAGGEDWRGLVGHIVRAEAVVAAAEGRLEDASPLFAKAVEIHRRHQVPFDEAETLHCWGRALLAAGDREAGRGKLDAAMELYRRHEAGDRWLEKVQADRQRAQQTGAVRAEPALELPATGTEKRPGEDSRLTGTFRQHGEYWTLSLAGSESRLKDRKGFHYIAWLLRHPDQELAAWDLVAKVEPGNSLAGGADPIERQGHTTITSGLGDAGAVLDATAKAQYKRRLTDLREELELAERSNDPGRVGKAREEIEFIRAEVSSAVRLGGRDRKSSSHAERARLAITKTVKAALDRIREADPELGRHLAVSIRTGYFCVYVPKQPINWQL